MEFIRWIKWRKASLQRHGLEQWNRAHGTEMQKDVLYLYVVRSSVWLGYRLQGWNDERVKAKVL